MRCGAWSAQQLSDGYVPLEVVKSMGGTGKQTGSLIRQGLWENAPGGFQFHDWLDYQPSGESVRAERAEAARRMREVRSKRKGTHRPEPESSDEVPPNVQANDDRTCDETSGEVRDSFGYPDPVPVPVPVPLPIPTHLKAGDAVAAHPSAQTLLAEWIDACDPPPIGRVKGHVAKMLGELYAEGVPHDDIRAGLIVWHQRRLNPATLPSVVHEVRQGPRTDTAARPSTTDQRVGVGLALVAKYAALEETS